MEVEEINVEEEFLRFVEEFKDASGTRKYEELISQMPERGLTSLVVDFSDLYSYNTQLALETIRHPDYCLPRFDSVLMNKLRVRDPLYAEEIGEAHVRFRGLPEATDLRKVGARHIGRMIMIKGIIVRATPIKPLLLKATFECRRCHAKTYVEQTGPTVSKPVRCSNPECKSREFDLIPEESVFVDYQQVTVQERPEDLPPGQLPRSMRVVLQGDLVDVARPGDRVSITGIVRAVMARTSRVFNLYLEANHVDTMGRELETIVITPEDEETIKKMAEDPWIHRKIIRSIAPSIYGYEHVKEAIAYMLFGGVPKELPDVKIRGDIHILLIGDPGVGKSQLLRYVARIAPRGLYTTGRGSTAAGLTAAVVRERDGGMVLEAGALVLADTGVCCIDEIDKMRSEDRTAIHPAMEQQVVSIAKGGIVATLNARAAILAAANPALGRYNPYQTVAQNINLPVTILSRFDLIFVLRDQPEPDRDGVMSEHILTLHRLRAPPAEPPIPPELLRKYICYAKQINPVLSDEAMERLREFYVSMRKASLEGGEGSAISITPRQLESLIRLAEARARMHLRDTVTAEDAEAVITLMKKSLEQVGIDMETGRIDIDLIMTGKPKSLRDRLDRVLSTIVEMSVEEGMVSEKDLYEELERRYGMSRSEASKLVDILMRDGVIYSPRPGYYKKT